MSKLLLKRLQKTLTKNKLEVPSEFQYTDRMKNKNIEVDSLDIWMGALVVFGLASVGFIIWLGITLSKL